MKTVGVILSLFAFSISSAATFVEATFNQAPTGLYSLTEIKKEWPGVTWEDGVAEGRVSVLDAYAGNGIRVTYPAGSVGPSQGGAQWKSLYASTKDTMFSEYWVRPSANFDFVKGGKLPGLCGSQCNTGGNVPTGSDGWSARMMWRTAGKVVLYLYYPDQPGTYAVDFPLSLNNADVLLQPNTWSKIRTQISLNTPGLKNGTAKVWFNDQLALDLTDLRLRDQDSMHINQFYFSTFHGGSDATWAPSVTCTMDFDQFWIGTDESSTAVRTKPSFQNNMRIENRFIMLPPSQQNWTVNWFDEKGVMQATQHFPAYTGSIPVLPNIGIRYVKLSSGGQSHYLKK